jgi:hypothetical protein
LNVRSCIIEETLERLRAWPLIDNEDFSIAGVEVMRDKAAVFGFGDRVREDRWVLGGEFLRRLRREAS